MANARTAGWYRVGQPAPSRLTKSACRSQIKHRAHPVDNANGTSSNGSRMKILLVEDNVADAALLEKQLVETGAFEVNLQRCRTVAEAERLANDEEFDVVLLDVDLPESSGIVAVQGIQAVCPNTPVLALSGEDNESAALAALSLGVEDYVIKGHCTVDVLVELIESAVQRFAHSGWDGKLQRLAVPENPTDLGRLDERLQPILAADRACGTRTVVFAARIERSLDKSGRTVDLDHSIFIVNGVGSAEDVEVVTEELIRALSVPIVAGKDRIRSVVTLGVAVSPDDALEPSELLAKALYALGQDEADYSGRWKYYSDRMNRRSAHRQRLLTDVRSAIDQDRLHLTYQPIVDAASRVAVRMEALLRWTRPDGFVTAAATFMPFVEENGLIQRVDDFVIDRVGRQIRDWELSDNDTLPVSINVSARCLTGDTLLPVITGMLERYSIAPRLIEVELTESAAITDLRKARAVLRELRALGIQVALDDFGCGYASLDYLRHLPVDRLKIDKTFVRDLDDRRTEAVTRATVALARSLDLKVTAEGVESERQADALLAMGCDELQGFYFARPAPARDEPTPARLQLRLADN